jgi:hypothetical protein
MPPRGGAPPDVVASPAVSADDDLFAAKQEVEMAVSDVIQADVF